MRPQSPLPPTPQPRSDWQAPTAGRSYDLPPLVFNTIPTGDAYHRDDAEGLREFDRLMGVRP